MQTEFITNKTNFLKLIDWVKENFPDISFYNNYLKKYDMCQLNNDKFDQQMVLVNNDSNIFEEAKNMEEVSYGLVWHYGVFITFGFSKDEAYSYDFTDYMDNEEPKIFYKCQLYADGYYSDVDEVGRRNEIYKLISKFIKKNSKKYKITSYWSLYVLDIKD